MGACDFVTFIEGKVAQDAFNQAVEEARYKYGHAGYTGTIAEKPGYEIVSSEPLSLEDADKFIKDTINKNPKWGEAWAIKVCDDKFNGYVFYGYASS